MPEESSILRFLANGVVSPSGQNRSFPSATAENRQVLISAVAKGGGRHSIMRNKCAALSIFAVGACGKTPSKTGQRAAFRHHSQDTRRNIEDMGSLGA